MSLTPEDVDAIAKMLDGRLAAQHQQLSESLAQIERRARNRRRFWLWFFIITTLASIVSSYLAVKHVITAVENQVSSVDRDLFETKVAYQKLLAHDREMQHDRELASAAVGYHSEQSQGAFDANLIAQMLKLVNKSHAQNEKMAKSSVTNPEDDLADLAGMGDMLNQAQNMMVQMLMHESDPAHATKDERIRTGEDQAPRRAPVIITQPDAVPDPTPTPATK